MYRTIVLLRKKKNTAEEISLGEPPIVALLNSHAVKLPNASLLFPWTWAPFAEGSSPWRKHCWSLVECCSDLPTRAPVTWRRGGGKNVKARGGMEQCNAFLRTLHRHHVSEFTAAVLACARSSPPKSKLRWGSQFPGPYEGAIVWGELLRARKTLKCCFLRMLPLLVSNVPMGAPIPTHTQAALSGLSGLSKSIFKSIYMGRKRRAGGLWAM